MEKYVVLLLIGLLAGCASTKVDSCKVSAEQVATLEKNIRVFMGEAPNGECSDVIAGEAFFHRNFKNACLVAVSYPHDKESCAPVLDGDYHIVFEPESLQPIEELPWIVPYY
ncbi:hypothetical protein [Microbulbifer variabilis]|uniref:hypothetical protein n=1 Tax=Microbulbifer variabilis TaxID=266805 RepID=UPI001CFC8C60|nr:hypothetical protein [Microbulbifer variabilis]